MFITDPNTQRQSHIVRSNRPLPRADDLFSLGVSTMTLEEVQAELRPITGTPYRDEADRLRRMTLWLRLDVLTAQARQATTPAEAPAEVVQQAPAPKPFEHYCHCGAWAAYGYGVNLRNGITGTWYCEAHRPDRNQRR
jgi:hypothetical protein